MSLLVYGLLWGLVSARRGHDQHVVGQLTLGDIPLFSQDFSIRRLTNMRIGARLAAIFSHSARYCTGVLVQTDHYGCFTPDDALLRPRVVCMHSLNALRASS